MNAFTNDRKITISVGASRKSTNWQRQDLTFSTFVEKLRDPVRTDETIEEFLKLPRAKQSELKDVGGFVGGALKGRRRKAANVEGRDLVTLDFDNIASGETKNVIDTVQSLGCAYVIYSTRKHIETRPRLRIIIPTDRTMSTDEYEPVARLMAKRIGIGMADPTTFEASRLMYWPSCSLDSSYVFTYKDNPFLKVKDALESYENWHDVTSWPMAPSESVKEKRELVKQQDPTKKRGIVGIFCRTYDIYSAMAHFIPQAYEATVEADRYTYIGGSTSGGAVVYQNGKFLYSHHATDPCSGQLVNAWDLVRLHKFGDLDEDAKPDCPTTSLPSYNAMRKLASTDPDVVQTTIRERHDDAETFFDDLGEGSEKEENHDWEKNLAIDGYGKIAKSIENIVYILEHSPDYKGKIFVDEFANRGMVELPLPWDRGEGSRIWNDFDDAHLALQLEKLYGITGPLKIETALKVVGHRNRRNEVKDWIKSLTWDGVPRIESLLHDYLGAEQNIYTESIMKKALAAAVARAFDGRGVKFDYMIIFTGRQGIGKSTFLAKLGMQWFSDSLYSFEGKEAAELIQGTLINEVGELSAMTRSEMEVVKQFLSKTHDIYREAYGKRANKYPRRCVFFGSTNSEEFLKDVTGNRRFWPVKVGDQRPTKSIFEELDAEVPQIWAEARILYMLGEPLYLSDEALAISEAMQDDFREVDPKEGMVAEFLDRKIPANWYEMSLQNQRAFYNNTFQMRDDVDLIERDKVCPAEIWQICFGGDIKYMRRRESNEILSILQSMKGWQRNKGRRRYGAFGQQRGFERINKKHIYVIKTEKHADESAKWREPIIKSGN